MFLGAHAGAMAVVGLLAAGCGTTPAAAPDVSPPAPHQPGLTTPPPPATTLLALDITAADRATLTTTLRTLHTVLVAHPAVEPTLSVGSSLFDHRYGLSDRRPTRLTPMRVFPGDVPDDAWTHGDLLLQLGGDRTAIDTAATAATAVDGLTTRWRVDGFRDTPAVTATGRATTRNLFGFTDGIANPDVTDTSEMDSLVWIQSGSGEPAWCTGGSYLVVRLIRFAVELWDADSEVAQERIFGRDKQTGAPLGTDVAEADPDYSTDPYGTRIALDAHVRRANPRTPGTEANRILRRGYSYDHGTDPDGHPDQGMAFICYQQDLERGFVTVQQRLDGEALQKYVLPFGGGYYLTLPGVNPARPDDYLGSALLA